MRVEQQHPTMKRSVWEAIYKTLANFSQRSIGGNAKWRYFTTRTMVALTPAIQVADALRRQTPGADEFTEEDVALITQYARRQPDGGLAAVGTTNLPDCADPEFFSRRAVLREQYAAVVEAEKQREAALALALDDEVTITTHGIAYSDLPEALPDAARALLWPLMFDDFAAHCAAEVPPALTLITDD